MLILVKDEGGTWTITQAPAASATNRVTDQVMAVGVVDIFATLESESSFELGDADAADFGLAEPVYVMVADGPDNATYTLRVGNPNPAGTRYYAFVNDNSETVYLMPNDLVQILIDNLETPPYVAAPTATPTPSATLNPLSEVEQATATGEANLTVTAQINEIMTMMAQQAATEEATAEATEPAAEADEAEADTASEAPIPDTEAEPTAEATEE